MPTYTISVIPISALNFTGAAPSAYQIQESTGGSWNWGSYQFTVDNSAAVGLTINDDDDTLQDDAWWGGETVGGIAHNQTAAADTQIGSALIPQGMQIENEYELNVLGSDGVVYRMAAIAMTPTGNVPGSGIPQVVGFTFDNGLWPPAGVTLDFTGGAGNTFDYQQLDDPAVPCFAGGTLILTPAGGRPVESLTIGDLVLTLEGDALPLRWIGHAEVSANRLTANPALRPLRIAAGALGEGMPSRDLVVSPQHRILLRSRVAERMFGATEVLVPAKALLDLPGVSVEPVTGPVRYWHFTLPGHRVVLAEGAPAETLYLGREILKLLPEDERDEMFRLNPVLAAAAVQAPQPARLLLRNRPARKLVSRLLQNGKPLIEAAPAGGLAASA